jgi:hypothetical protein
VEGRSGDHRPACYFMGWYGGDYGAEQCMRPNSIARAPQYIPGEETPENRAHDMVKDLQGQRTAPPVGSLWDSFDLYRGIQSHDRWPKRWATRPRPPTTMKCT